MTKIQLKIPLIIAAAMLVQPGYAVPPTITFSPVSPMSLSANQTTSGGPPGGPPMTITCTQKAVAGTIMVSLYIKRVPTTGGAEQVLVSADINNKVPQVASGVTGMTADGNLTDTRSMIRGTITQMTCDKAGMYICESTYGIWIKTTMDRVIANYTVDVTPGSVEIVSSAITPPSGSLGHAIGDSVQFICSANVGSVDSTTRIVFVWEYESDSFGLPSFVSYPNFEDIDSSQTPAPPTAAACSSQIWKSYLTRNLTLDDSERRYRCYVSKNNVDYRDHAAIYTLPIVQDPANPVNPGGGSTGGNNGSVGAVVRGVVETVTILVIIAVVVVN